MVRTPYGEFWLCPTPPLDAQDWGPGWATARGLRDLGREFAAAAADADFLEGTPAPEDDGEEDAVANDFGDEDTFLVGG